MSAPAGLRFRAAGPGDAHAIAALHAGSWQRHYRGAFSDAFLDNDVAGYLLPDHPEAPGDLLARVPERSPAHDRRQPALVKGPMNAPAPRCGRRLARCITQTIG
jgi:hypothetical protein